MNEHLSLGSQVLLTPLRNGLRTGSDNVVEVLVRIQAPDAPDDHIARRPPQALALVIDRSGSMAGHPIREAQRCARHVVSRMAADDLLAIVDFDTEVRILMPAAPVGDGEAAWAAIGAIEDGGRTNLHGGWQAGADALAALQGVPTRRVILLSDGQANEGLVDSGRIVQHVARATASGVTTSTYGLGRNFNESLMVAMAQAGLGGHYYGDLAEDLFEPFQREMELLAHRCLTRLRLTARTPDGVALDCINDVPYGPEGFALPDLAWDAEAWVLLRLRMPAGLLTSAGGTMPLLNVDVRAETLSGEPVAMERASLALRAVEPHSWLALPEDGLVRRRLVELNAAQQLDAMRLAASHGDWDRVDSVLRTAEAELAGHAWVESILQGMRRIAESRERQRMLKESMYSSINLKRRLAGKLEGDGFSVAEDTPAFLRRKPMQGKGDL